MHFPSPTHRQRCAQTHHTRLGRTVAVALLLCLSVAARAALASQIHARYMSKTSKELLAIADSSAGGKYGPNDTVMICYAIVANRYAADQSKSEKIYAIEACLRLYSRYFYLYYDYPKCFEYLSKAKEIARDIGLEEPRIELGFGAMYRTISEETRNRELCSKAVRYFQEAFDMSWRKKDDMHMDMAFTNLISLAYDLDSLDNMGPTVKTYKSRLGDTVLWKYNILYYDALRNVRTRQLDKASAIFERLIGLIPHKPYYDRLRYFTLVSKTRLLKVMQQTDSAIIYARSAEQIAIARQQKDLKLEVFNILSELYKQKGDEQRYLAYREDYYLLRDTLLNYQQVASVNEMEFQAELKNMNEEMTELKHKRDVQSLVTLIVIVVSAVVLALLFVIYRQNRHLKRSNAQLYRQNVEMLAADEEQRQLRHQMASQQDDAGDDADNVKYKNSNLDEIAKNQLLESIRAVMENVDETCQAGFSIERLATLVGSKYKYVSQVIHEKHGCNFNNLLNQYRIKEACKRMNDLEQYGNYTIEAISTSVGFRSRSTFVASFKRFTGLTPSEYQSMAREAND